MAILQASPTLTKASDQKMSDAKMNGLSHNERLYLGVLLAVVVLAYSNTLWNSFTMDDMLYIHLNPQVTAPSVSSLLTPDAVSNVFRPVTFATLAINWAVGRDRPVGFHLVNLFLHAAVVCLLYFLLQRLLASLPLGNKVAFVASLLFAVHPIHTEAVTSIVGRAEVLAAGFLIAAWVFHLQDSEIPALVCLVLAVLSKESAVVLLPLVLVGDYAIGKFKSYSRYARIAGVTLLYLGALWKFQGGHFGVGTAAISKLDNPLASLPAGWRILNALHVAWKYLGLQFYPATLSCDYSFNAIPVYSDLRHCLPWALATVVVLAAWLWAVRKRQIGLVLAGGMYLAAFAPTANILTPVGTIMGERLAYLPSAGFCLMIALLWSWLRRGDKRVAFGVLIVAVAALSGRTVVRNRDWKNNFTLYAAAVRAVPGSAKMHASLGLEYMNADQPDLARKELETALQINPEFPDALESYGLLEVRLGHEQKGGHMLEQAFYMSSHRDVNYDYRAVNLAALLIKNGYMEGAMEILNREIAESPKYARAWSNRAVIHFKRGETAEARSDAEAALRLEPGNPQAINVLHLLDAGSPPVSAPNPTP